jgi:hypothetical protein
LTIQGGSEFSDDPPGKCIFDIEIEELGAKVWCVPL